MRRQKQPPKQIDPSPPPAESNLGVLFVSILVLVGFFTIKGFDSYFEYVGLVIATLLPIVMLVFLVLSPDVKFSPAVFGILGASIVGTSLYEAITAQAAPNFGLALELVSGILCLVVAAIGWMRSR